MGSSTEELAANLLRCPGGCAFLLTIERDEIPVALAVTPRQAFARAAIALRALNPWSPVFKQAVTAALSRGSDLASLASTVAAHPASRWWIAPMDQTRKVLVVDDTPPPVSSRAAPPRHILARIFHPFKRASARTASPDSLARWEAYAQRPVAWRITSTLRGAYSCVDTIIASGIGDWMQVETHRRFAAVVDASARVYEISGPADWHALCVSFPRVNQNPASPAGVGTLVPDWGRVATQ